MDTIRQTPSSAWRKIQIEGVARIYKTPKILDQKITLKDYEGPLRQMTIIDLGHESPTILITNQMNRSPAKLIRRYAQRMLIENGIADGIDFFHMDALYSAVAMKFNCDLQLTLPNYYSVFLESERRIPEKLSNFASSFLKSLTKVIAM